MSTRHLLPLSLRAQSRSLLLFLPCLPKRLAKAWPLFLLLPLFLTSCYKDEVAEADLTTNALDPDYDGEPFLELVSDSTYRLFDGFGVPIDTVIEFKFHVRIELFPAPTAYEPFGVQVNNGATYTGPVQTPYDTEASVLHHHVEQGTNYCMDVSIKCQSSSTRSYRFCADADL